MAQETLQGEWVPLSSSNVRAARYDADLRTLSVMFQSGAEYDYYEVPQTVADGLFNSSSPGRYVRNELSGYEYSGG